MGIACPQNLDVLLNWNPVCKETSTVPSLSVFFWANNFSLIFFPQYTEESFNAAGIWCDPGLQVCPFLFSWSCDGRTCHLTFIVYYDRCVIFRVKDHTIFSLVWPLLSHYHCWMYLLSELWFAFLERDHHHVTHTSSRKSIQHPLIPFTEMIYRFLAPIKEYKQIWRLLLRANQAVLRFSNTTSSTHTPKLRVPTRWNTLSHHRLKQNNTTSCRFTQKRCFHSALSWRLSGSSAKGPLSAFKRVYLFFNKWGDCKV